ncbi:hypothetical protein [Amantichitinum ursilacus]|uniref:Uncharacterized protein n=1 Tax=Amantichitinum ursilacus TaxID=857265 RepID=A0A0N1JTL9_9NEIS|nr:hypothetical protein [Amantichitinum ursilacus]KPC55163.1 hypothetical protein WG78_00855 [Amantichitinum ursilacus]
MRKTTAIIILALAAVFALAEVAIAQRFETVLDKVELQIEQSGVHGVEQQAVPPAADMSFLR